MTGALHAHARFTCVIYFNKTLILLSKSTYPVSNVIHIILLSGRQGDIPAKNIHESSRKEEKKRHVHILED